MRAAEDVAFPRGSATLRGHLSRSQINGERRAVVLIPDVYGLSPLYREIAGSLADRGFTTLAVDLCTREGVPKLSGPAEAMRWIAGLSDPRVLDAYRPEAAADAFERAVGFFEAHTSRGR